MKAWMFLESSSMGLRVWVSSLRTVWYLLASQKATRFW